MGLLIEGKWHDKWYDTKSSGGKFVREQSKFHHQIGQENFAPEKGRYHLYVSLACPWAHRTLIFRKLKQLEDIISVDIVHPHMLNNGWELLDENGNSSDSLYQFTFMHQIYTKAKTDYTGRVTVPVLWDKKQQTIVNNESAEIIRMFNDAFNDLTNDTQDFYPEKLRQQIDAINDKVYNGINNGVYRCGFATTQDAYDEAYDKLFTCLADIEALLAKQPYLVGDTLTEADWRLFTTLIRFDAVYFGHFKCNQQQIKDMPNLQQYLLKLYHTPGIASTVNFEHIKQHYYYSHTTINPTQVVPKGPLLEFTQ